MFRRRDDFERIRSTLARGYRVIAPIMPGYLGTPPIDDVSFEAIAHALLAELRNRRIERVAAIVGYSSGSYRALDLVLRHGLAADRVIARRYPIYDRCCHRSRPGCSCGSDRSTWRVRSRGARRS